MNLRLILMLWLATLFLSSCASNEDYGNNRTQSGDNEVYSTIDERTEGDFVYRLVTEKGNYQQGESVVIYAELEYVGDEESIAIYHAASPFYFPMVEKTRNYEIPYPMEEPLINTILVQGEPYREEYSPRGGHSSEEDKKYIDYINTLIHEGFPTGKYVVNGFADFFVENEDSELTKYQLNAQIAFTVSE